LLLTLYFLDFLRWGRLASRLTAEAALFALARAAMVKGFACSSGVPSLEVGSGGNRNWPLEACQRSRTATCSRTDA
jgi:hypothetical protein